MHSQVERAVPLLDVGAELVRESVHGRPVVYHLVDPGDGPGRRVAVFDAFECADEFALAAG